MMIQVITAYRIYLTYCASHQSSVVGVGVVVAAVVTEEVVAVLMMLSVEEFCVIS